MKRFNRRYIVANYKEIVSVFANSGIHNVDIGTSRFNIRFIFPDIDKWQYIKNKIKVLCNTVNDNIIIDKKKPFIENVLPFEEYVYRTSCEIGDIKTFRTISSTKKIDINHICTNNCKSCVLFLACLHNKSDIVRIIIDPKTIISESLLDFAILHCNSCIIKMLLLVVDIEIGKKLINLQPELQSIIRDREYSSIVANRIRNCNIPFDEIRKTSEAYVRGPKRQISSSGLCDGTWYN